MTTNPFIERKVEEKQIRHGMRETRFYKIWDNMHTRCTTTKDAHQRKYYGMKGIIIEWSDFTAFFGDMYPSYIEHVKQYGEPDTTIDRKDGDGNYSKANCRWATRAEQNRNLPSNITFKGELAKAASERLGGSKHLVDNRISLGWSKELAFTAPLFFRPRPHQSL